MFSGGLAQPGPMNPNAVGPTGWKARTVALSFLRTAVECCRIGPIKSSARNKSASRLRMWEWRRASRSGRSRYGREPKRPNLFLLHRRVSLINRNEIGGQFCSRGASSPDARVRPASQRNLDETETTRSAPVAGRGCFARAFRAGRISACFPHNISQLLTSSLLLVSAPVAGKRRIDLEERSNGNFCVA